MALPNGVVTRADVGRLALEAEALDSALNAAAVRGNGSELPKTSQLLNEMVAMNKLNLLQPNDRKSLLTFLQATRTSAPTLHISFNTDPSPVFQQGLITWIRREINPALLLQIGLHPSIGAGCVVRTTNKYFDFSLRNRFAQRRDVLMARLHGDEPVVAAASVAPATQEVVAAPAPAPASTPEVAPQPTTVTATPAEVPHE
jgi:F0F1-type ATP synthase delta subunit